MKGLILSGGKGSRLRPLTYTGAKQLVPIANKPVLFYAIECLAAAGITDIGIVVGDTGDQIRAAVGDGSRFGIHATYIEQEAPLGIAHGVKIARDFIGNDRFILFLGDNFVRRDDIASLAREFAKDTANSRVFLHPVKNPQDFGVAELVDGRITRLVEKPSHPKSNLALVGIYMFDSHIFEAVDSIKPSARNELEITDAIQWLVDKGFQVKPHLLTGWWIDTGKKDDLLDANRLILETLETKIEGSVDQKSQVNGRLVLEKGAQVINSVIRGPVAIGQDTIIADSYIGPFTSIYHHCRVEHSEIEHSIVLEYSAISDIGHRIEDSLIGRYVEISRSPIKPRAHKMLLGDHSKVGIV